MTTALETKFVCGDKVLFVPDSRIYDFGYIGSTGKAIIYEQGENNMQSSIAVDLKNLKKMVLVE